MNITAFNEAVAKLQTLSERPSNEILLKLYALYKQATEGDVGRDRPGGFDFKGAAKYNAWETIKGKSKDDAADEYISLVNSLL